MSCPDRRIRSFPGANCDGCAPTSREADALGRQSYLEIALHRQEAAQALELDSGQAQAKDLYGLTTTKAKRFLDELEGD